MGRREPTLREELLTARARLTEQIERLANPGSLGVDVLSVDNSALIAELTGVLREIDFRLEELGPDPTGG